MTADGRAALAPLYDPAYEHDACGVGLVADIAGRPSRAIVTQALAGAVNLTHRGGVGADARTGDGTGLLTQLPFKLFQPDLARLGVPSIASGDLAVAMLFLPPEPEANTTARALLLAAFAHAGLPVLGWRNVPTDPTVLGPAALRTLPDIVQATIVRPAELDELGFERGLFLARRAAERAWQGAGFSESDAFVVSCSARTIVYKGFCLPEDLPAFYVDLCDENFASAIALFHQRYSTNTLPTWAMAQPFRTIAHNGEINTIGGNRRWMEARAPQLAMPGIDADALRPVVSWAGSDSLSFDNVVELLVHGGRSLPHALMMLVPEPWEGLSAMDPARRAFYDFHAGLIEQWDGPAALGFSDGVLAGVALDRNGLRPMRYAITGDGAFIAGSEAGTIPADPASVVEKGRLGPGQMILVDTRRGLVLRNDALKAEAAAGAPYAEWLSANRVELPPMAPAPAAPARVAPARDDAPARPIRKPADAGKIALQRAFGYSAEDLRLIVQPMAVEAKEPIWSMGDDAPLAVLSDKPRPLHAYFRQRFAQVTNPAIDSLRERSVMALDSLLGRRGNLLAESPEQARLLHLPSVVVDEPRLAAIANLDGDGVRAVRVSTLVSLATVDPEHPGAALLAALDRVVEDARTAIRGGAGIIILSDRGVDAERAPLPMLLAVGSVHHALIGSGERRLADLVAETGDVCDVHALACLIGYGASAVCPWLGLDAAADYAGARGCEDRSADDLRANYIVQMEKGFLKIASKMGISTAMGYRGAQAFETVGVAADVIERAFRGTPARLGGIGFAEIATDVLRRHAEGFAETASKLPDYGFVRYRKDGEPHAYEPPTVKALQAAVNSGDRALYAAYRAHVANHPPTAIRDLLTLRPLGPIVPLDEVEPVADIVTRFVVTAMSLGALSPEAHRTLSVGMNRLGGRSNSGEGGEDPTWYDEPGPDVAHSKIKQVASGRFGVTSRYLAMAEELEIKIAQGSKPGEGGQLPGHKVTEFVARIRHAVPGLPLISPPPHHDIYSIEDLAQLIHDLRQINPRARVGVKLVAEAGVGTVAAGVAKAKADYVLISGHAGGTGASPLASIKHAGCPWELGLAEAQQTLVMNGLRSRVRLRTDGGIKTAEDIATAAMLGAEEFGFGASVLIAIGCDMARQCHLNTCPTGIATQREDLRARFAGTPEQVINYFVYLAESVRELLARLGARSLNELVGRSDLLAVKPLDGRAALLDPSALIVPPAPEAERRKTRERPADPPSLDDALLPTIVAALEQRQPVALAASIRTADRTVGAKIAHTIVTRPWLAHSPGAVTIRYVGSAGQSFGAFLVDGMRLLLEGEANDYVGKGLSGGEIAIRPPHQASFATPQVIAGNTILYGATGGALYLAGQAGERFAVRNSGATAVVEGVGDHGCEYMTGGLVVVLGRTGRNFGAGMTNGRAVVHDPDGMLPSQINDESVLLEPLGDSEETEAARAAIARHVELTGSTHARALLERWTTELRNFWLVVPRAAAARIEIETTPEEIAGAAD
ncbi:MAG: glutamate synthase large subunit [Thermomicrobiales bacterium]|nr:glutamate synthase large subunit [Thermomicrobiales bacterium]